MPWAFCFLHISIQFDYSFTNHIFPQYSNSFHRNSYAVMNTPSSHELIILFLYKPSVRICQSLIKNVPFPIGFVPPAIEFLSIKHYYIES